MSRNALLQSLIALQMAHALNMHFEFNFYIIIHIEYGNEYDWQYD